MLAVSSADPPSSLHTPGEDQFIQNLTSSLQKMETNRLEAGSSAPTTPAPTPTASGTSKSCGGVEGGGSSGKAAPLPKETTGKNKKNRSKKRLNGLQSPKPPRRGGGIDRDIFTPPSFLSENQFALLDSGLEQFGDEAEFVSPKTRRKKKNNGNNGNNGSNVAVHESTDSGFGDSNASTTSSSKAKKGRSSLKVPKGQLPASGLVLKHGGKKGHKLEQCISFENSSVSSASPSSSVCSHSPLTLSPSPTSSFSNHLPIAVELESSMDPTFHRGRSEEESSEGGKDEWPDLGMETAPPLVKIPASARVYTHLEVEAKSLEEVAIKEEEEEKMEGKAGGCELDEECTTEARRAEEQEKAVGKEEEEREVNIVCNVEFKSHVEPVHILPQPPHSAGPAGVMVMPPNPPSTFPAPSVGVSGMHCFTAGGILGGAMFGGDLTSPAQQMPPQQYLWMQEQQLKAFIQQHQEQHEKQTDNQIFFPLDPLPRPHSMHPPNLVPLPPPLMAPHLPSPPHHHPPQMLNPSRPLFFPPRSPQTPHITPLSQATTATTAATATPPHPPPPPPLPVHHYMPPTLPSQLHSDTGE